MVAENVIEQCVINFAMFIKIITCYNLFYDNYEYIKWKEIIGIFKGDGVVKKVGT